MALARVGLARSFSSYSSTPTPGALGPRLEECEEQERDELGRCAYRLRSYPISRPTDEDLSVGAQRRTSPRRLLMARLKPCPDTNQIFALPPNLCLRQRWATLALDLSLFFTG